MGFQLFETSGTFNPTTWGLKVGDCIHIVCMGGGGGGGGSSYSSSKTSAGHTTGTAGGTSSFGSVISSAGGSGGGASVGSSGGAKGASFSGAGAGGWMPNVCLPSPGLEDVVEGYIPISGGSVGKGVTLAGSTGFYVTPDDNSGNWLYSNSAIAATRYYAGCGQQYIDTLNGPISKYPRGWFRATGGYGYGAGGSGCRRHYETGGSNYITYSTGGNSGVYKTASYVLTSTSTIAVTIGAGGAGGTGKVVGGAGTAGCVAVYW